MGDSSAPTSYESTAATLGAFLQNYPALMQAYQGQVLPTEQANLDASKVISPQYESLLNNLYAQYGPQLQKTGSAIDTASRNATANTDVNILGDQGAKLAQEYKNIDQSVNPEYYKTRELESQKLGQLLNSVNLDNPNPEAERLVNQENQRSGNAGVPANATNIVGNALQFGKQADSRRSQLSSAISQATQFLQPSSNAQFNPATAILNKPTSNTGTSQFAGVNSPSSTAYSAGSGLLNNIAGFQNTATQVNANKRDVLDRVNETMSSI